MQVCGFVMAYLHQAAVGKDYARFLVPEGGCIMVDSVFHGKKI